MTEGIAALHRGDLHGIGVDVVGVVLFHPLLPCQALGQALFLSHQGRGIL